MDITRIEAAALLSLTRLLESADEKIVLKAATEILRRVTAIQRLQSRAQVETENQQPETATPRPAKPDAALSRTTPSAASTHAQTPSAQPDPGPSHAARPTTPPPRPSAVLTRRSA